MPNTPPAAADDFGSLLDARTRLAGSGAETMARSYRQCRTMPDLAASAEPLADAPRDMPEALSRAYAEEEAHPPTLPGACDPEALARELGLGAELTARDLERVRRSFARANHPDRAPAAERDLATLRMTLANALIDQALAKHGRKSRR